MTKIKNLEDRKLVLPNGVELPAGGSRPVKDWDDLKGHPVVAAWLNAKVIAEDTGDAPVQDGGQAPTPLTEDELKGFARTAFGQLEQDAFNNDGRPNANAVNGVVADLAEAAGVDKNAIGRLSKEAILSEWDQFQKDQNLDAANTGNGE